MVFGRGTLNKVMLIGRLGGDPELKYTQNGVAVTRINLATNRVWKDESGNQIEKTDWHRVIAWRKTAELLGEYLKKGNQVFIEGHLETRTWDDPNGQKHYMTEVIVENFVLMGRREDRASPDIQSYEPPPGPPHGAPPETPEDTGDTGDTVGEEDDLPF